MNQHHVVDCPQAQVAQLPSCPVQTPEGHLCSSSCCLPWLEHIDNCVDCKNHILDCPNSKCSGFAILRRGKLQVRNMAEAMKQGPRHLFPTKFPTRLCFKEQEDWKPQIHGYEPSNDDSHPTTYYVISPLEGNMRAIRHQPEAGADLFIPEGAELVVKNLSYKEALVLCHGEVPNPLQSPTERRVELTLTMFSLLKLEERLEPQLKKVGINFGFQDFLDWVREFSHTP